MNRALKYGIISALSGIVCFLFLITLNIASPNPIFSIISIFGLFLVLIGTMTISITYIKMLKRAISMRDYVMIALLLIVGITVLNKVLK